MIAGSRDPAIVLDAQFEDWRIWDEQGRYEEAQAALAHLKQLLFQAATKGIELGPVKIYLHELKARKESADFVAAFYATWAQVFVRDRSSPAVVEGEIVRRLDEMDRMAVAALTEAAFDLHGDDDRKKLVAVLFEWRKKHETLVYEQDRSRYKELQDTRYLYDLVAESCEKATARAPSAAAPYDFFYFMAGQGHHGNWRLKEAAAAYEKVVFGAPQSPYFLECLQAAAAAYMPAPDQLDPKAADFIEALRERYPTNPEVPRHMTILGSMYLWRNETEKARRMFSRVLSEYPEDESADIAHDFLLQIERRVDPTHA